MPELNLETLKLERGAHESAEHGMCVMEAVAFVAGEPFSDHPGCASEVVGAFLRTWNDQLNDRQRQMLKPLVSKLVGSRATVAVEAKRAWLAIDWLLRTWLPTWLELAGLGDAAEALRQLREVFDLASLGAASPLLDRAKKESAAAGAAARAAAWAAARAAAWDAAWAAAEKALAPTIGRLQKSALDLVERMLAVVE